jgi:hypothetical protein
VSRQHFQTGLLIGIVLPSSQTILRPRRERERERIFLSVLPRACVSQASVLPPFSVVFLSVEYDQELVNNCCSLHFILSLKNCSLKLFYSKHYKNLRPVANVIKHFFVVTNVLASVSCLKLCLHSPRVITKCQWQWQATFVFMLLGQCNNK